MQNLGQPGLFGRLYRIRLLSALLLAAPGLLLGGWYAYSALSSHLRYNAALGVEQPLTAELFHLHLYDHLRRDCRRLTMPEPERKSPLPAFDLALGNGELARLNENLPPGDGKSRYVDGYITRGNEIHEVRVRYRGRKHWHWNYAQKSWKVRLEDGDFLDGHTVFNLVNTVDPLPFSEQIILDIARESGLLTPDYLPIRLTLNHANLGLYFFSSQPDEGLLRRARRMPGSMFSGNEAPIDPETGISTLWKDAANWKKVATRDGEKMKDFSLLEKLLAVVNTGSQPRFAEFAGLHLSVDKFALFDALDVVFGGNQHDFHQNHKLYFDPYRARFEPIAWEFKGWRNPDVLNRTENPLLLRLKELPGFRTLRNRYVHKLLRGSCSPESIRSRAEEMFGELTSEQARDPYWDAYRLLPGISRYYRQMVRPMDQERQALVFETRMGRYRRRAGFLLAELGRLGLTARLRIPEPEGLGSRLKGQGEGGRALLTVSVAGHAGYRLVSVKPEWPEGCTPESWRLSAAYPDGERPVAEVTGAGEAAAQLELHPGNLVVDRTVHHPHRGNVRAVPAELAYPLVLNSSCVPLAVTIEGLNLVTDQPVRVESIPFGEREQARTGPDCADGSFSAVPGHTSLHPWCYPVVEEERVALGPGEIRIKKTLVYGPKTTVEIAPGTSFLLSKKASIVFLGRVTAQGTPDKPIVLAPKKKRWGGLILQGPGTRGSRLVNVTVTRGTVPRWQLGYYPGMVNIHDTSDIEISDSHFGENRKSDDTLHAAYVQNLSIRSSNFTNCESDAVDLEFCKAKLTDVTVVGAGDECLDLMGSKTKVRDSRLIWCGSNGISAGEETKVQVVDSLVAEADVGLLVKNASKAVVSDSLFWMDQTAVAIKYRSARYGKKSRVVMDTLHAVECNRTVETEKGGDKRIGSVMTDFDSESLQILKDEVLDIDSWDQLPLYVGGKVLEVMVR